MLLASLVTATPALAARDQVVISGSVLVPRGQTVGDVVVIDGPVTVAGHATGDVVAVHGRVDITGQVDGDVAAVSRTAVLAPTARVGGDVLYGSARPRITPGASVGGTVTKKNWDDVVGPGWGWRAHLALWFAVSVSTLVLGLLLLWFAPRAADAVLAAWRDTPGGAVGWGIALMIGLPLAAVIAVVTLVGIPFGIGLLLALLPLLAIGYAYGCWMLGRSLLGPPRSRVPAFLAGWAILRLVALVPFLGGVAGFLVTAAGLGAALLAIWRARRTAAPVAMPVAAG
jgi:cytoskeletal protein CcmA (bactofilin family)